MLKKILKYELQALKRYILPLFACTLGIGVLAAVIGMIAFTLPNNDAGTVLRVLSSMSYVLLIICISVLSFIAVIMILYRYYKSCFSDEGYLTFILPVDTDTLIVGKLLSGALVSFISSLVMICSLMIAIIPPIFISAGSDFSSTLSEILDTLRFLISTFEMATWQWTIVIVEIAITFILGVFSQITLFYAAITLGSIIMHKHKILGSVLFYFLINFATQILSNLYSLIVLTMIDSGDAFLSFEASILFSILINAGLFVLGYMTIRSMLKNRLNLE